MATLMRLAARASRADDRPARADGSKPGCWPDAWAVALAARLISGGRVSFFVLFLFETEWAFFFLTA